MVAEYRVSIGICGCIHSSDVNNVPVWLSVVDTDNIPNAGIWIGSLNFTIDGIETAYPLLNYYADFATLLSYLNTIFVDNWDFNGSFRSHDGFIQYSNPEHFDKIEIMALYGTKVLCFKFGDGGDKVPNMPITNAGTPIAAGSDTIDGSFLQDYEILSYRWNAQPLENVTAVVTQDEVTKTLVFDDSFGDGFLYITVCDAIPSYWMFGDSLPIILS